MAGAVRRVGVEERRARLGLRHHLAAAARVDSAVEAADGVVALHGTDPASVFLAAWARMRSAEVATIERTLYEDRALVRILGMRRTMFVVSVELAPIVQASCAHAIAVKQRRLLLQHLDQAAIADEPASWLKEVEESTVAALAARGESLAAELYEHEPRLQEQLLVAPGKPYEARQAVATRILFLLAAEGRIIRGRPRGSWISGQFRWAPIEAWLPGGLPEWPVETARVELVRRWLAAFGPGTAADLK